jgi:hypothetical protein
VAGTKGRGGGKQAGAGRPKVRPEKLPWKLIEAAAQAGATELEIVRAYGITEAALSDPAILARFREELSRGHARQALGLRIQIQRRGTKTTEGSGSVNALALQARNILDWDKQLPAQETEPDLGTARQRLKDSLEKLALARSEIEGKKVTVLELIRRESMVANPKKPGG